MIGYFGVDRWLARPAAARAEADDARLIPRLEFASVDDERSARVPVAARGIIPLIFFFYLITNLTSLYRNRLKKEAKSDGQSMRLKKSNWCGPTFALGEKEFIQPQR